LIIDFSSDISGIEAPDKFSFPFYYTPHPLAVTAAKELMEYLRIQKDWEHNFGLDPNSEGLEIGKMFGVLVVQKADGGLAYLRAFSGKLANSNSHKGFVSPVYDMLSDSGFFKQEEEVLNEINRKIEILENEENYLYAISQLKFKTDQADCEILEGREKLKAGKKSRKQIRKEAKETLTDEEYIDLEEKLKAESIRSNYVQRDLAKYWNAAKVKAQEALNIYQDPINHLKQERKRKSAALQKRLFSNYTFKNQKGKDKSLLDIFKETITKTPPAGAGECAAPKLLQHAFLNNLKPICMAEFWWGKSPSAEVRKTETFYPACRGKCEPILGHMLSETDMDPNPMLTNPALGKSLDFLYEDDHLVIVNKPAEFLSVPGKNIADSVQARMVKRYPDATGPLVVHRLDMSTSGIMLIAKNSNTHKQLQRQFIKRSIKKRYVAVLEGELKDDHGQVNLPLRVDLNDRPRQLVCHEHGKQASTLWESIEVKDGRTRVYFYPRTGRTHQLRVHAAHTDGLNNPIVGDDLYGKKGKRLLLHAESITFEHPDSRKLMTIQCPPPF